LDLPNWDRIAAQQDGKAEMVEYILFMICLKEIHSSSQQTHNLQDITLNPNLTHIPHTLLLKHKPKPTTTQISSSLPQNTHPPK
jgi:hypothetical protein